MVITSLKPVTTKAVGRDVEPVGARDVSDIVPNAA